MQKKAENAINHADKIIEEQAEINKTVAEITNKIENLEQVVLSDAETTEKDEKEFMIVAKVTMKAMKVIVRVQESEKAVNRIVTEAKRGVNKAEAEALETEFLRIIAAIKYSITNATRFLRQWKLSSRSEPSFKTVVSYAKTAGTSIEKKQIEISDLINKIYSKVMTAGSKSSAKRAAKDFNDVLKETKEALEELSTVESKYKINT